MKYAVCLIVLMLASCATTSPEYGGVQVSNISKVEYNQSLRLKWEKLAKANNAEAQYRLGHSYCCGQNGYFDRDKAIYWWCKAAQQGHKQARQALAVNKITKCRSQ